MSKIFLPAFIKLPLWTSLLPLNIRPRQTQATYWKHCCILIIQIFSHFGTFCKMLDSATGWQRYVVLIYCVRLSWPCGFSFELKCKIPISTHNCRANKYIFTIALVVIIIIRAIISFSVVQKLINNS